MPISVFHEDLASPPVRNRKRVSFENRKKPLTPHNKNKQKLESSSISSTSKSVVSGSSLFDIEKAGMPLAIGKENFTTQLRSSTKKPRTKDKTKNEESTENKSSSLSSFRRSLLATMKSPKAATTAILAPIDRRNGLAPAGLGPPQRLRTVALPKTPCSMLRKELEMVDPDMSFLMSPSAMGNPNSLSNSPLFNSPPLPPFVADNKKQNLNSVEEPHQERKPAFSTNRRILAISEKRRAVAKQSKSNATKLPPMDEAREPTGTTPFHVRGNGVQMDLSSMFSDFQSPVKQSLPIQMAENLAASAESRPPPIVPFDNMQKGLVLDFGDEKVNKVGQSRSLAFVLEFHLNASDDNILEIDRVPVKRGFELLTKDPALDKETTALSLFPNLSDALEAQKSTLTIKPGKKTMLWLRWTPIEAGSVRETITLRLSKGRGRLRITVLGHAESAEARKEVSFGPCFVTRYPSVVNISKLSFRCYDFTSR